MEKIRKHPSRILFPTKEQQNTRLVSKANQELGEVLLVKWVAESFRPFHIVEDNGFRDLATFLCRVNGKFSVPTRNNPWLLTKGHGFESTFTQNAHSRCPHRCNTRTVAKYPASSRVLVQYDRYNTIGCGGVSRTRRGLGYSLLLISLLSTTRRTSRDECGFEPVTLGYSLLLIKNLSTVRTQDHILYPNTIRFATFVSIMYNCTTSKPL